MHFFISRRRKNIKANRKSFNVYSKQQIDASNAYLKEIIALRKTIPNWDSFFSQSANDRESDWIRLEVLGQPLSEKYSWAIPNDRALEILGHFSPIVEIGAGKGYWASLLSQRGVDITAYDIFVDSKNSWTTVQKGGPKVLKHIANKGRTLFLCYPDEAQDMSIECLDNYSGEYIVHVGELITTGTLSGSPQAPFGRTTSSDFSVRLAEEFHCVLTAQLPRFPFSNDCITVWKRTKWVQGRARDGDDDGEEDEEEADEDKEENEDDDEWADIPASERMPLDRAAPCLEHLLR